MEGGLVVVAEADLVTGFYTLYYFNNSLWAVALLPT